ncbi:hypothetical protein LCGC14_2045820 [marine sediment metagenome]|uniref:Uncharacterized protein n=1 Tax=marine sediment metagenome TaxID=412755 RepID=A0A0F9EQP0_9ZZZZ
MRKIGYILTLVVALLLAIPAMVVAAPLEMSFVPEVETVFDIVPVAVEPDGISAFINYNFINYQGNGAEAAMIRSDIVSRDQVATYLWDTNVVPLSLTIEGDSALLAVTKPIA